VIRQGDATRTRFAPAPTGYLHLGHVTNAIHVWGLAAEAGASVLLRIEDHDRMRSRAEYDSALLEDVAWLGFRVDEGPVRQSDDDRPYAEAIERLRAADLVYGCACSRATFERWAEDRGAPWQGPGCPGDCRRLALDGPVWRVALGGGSERWMDLLVGPCANEVAAGGDPPIRDRDGNWTYLLAVVVDDLRQGVDLVVRGRDLLASTPDQIRLGHLLGRHVPPTFAHHALVRRPDGSKLSKSAGDTGVRELRAAGHGADDVIATAAAAVGYGADPNIGRRPIERRGSREAHTR
jgi:glutamyl/glutaminyl-tRNA synthetase